MADSIENIELPEITPQTSPSETLHDAVDVQEHAVDTQQSDDDPPSSPNTQDPVTDREPSGDTLATPQLWQRAIIFGKNTTVVDVLTFCGFPLLVLGAWATIKAIRVAEWTQWKDSFEWCENHNYVYPGCAPLRDDHLKIPAGLPTMKRFSTSLSIEGFHNTLLTGSGISVMNNLASTLYLLVVISFDMIRRFSKSRTASGSAKTGSSEYQNIEGLDRPFMLSKLNSLEEELEVVRAEAAGAVEEQSKLRTQLVATNAQTAASLAELNGRLTTLKSELKKSFAEVRTETKELRETALSGLDDDDTKKVGVSTALVNDNAQDTQCDERSESHIHNKGIRKRLPDIREREHSGLVW